MKSPCAVQLEFNRGLLDTVVKAACIVELQEERDREAQRADLYTKAVANRKHAAVSDLVDARTSVMLASQLTHEVCAAAIMLLTTLHSARRLLSQLAGCNTIVRIVTDCVIGRSGSGRLRLESLT